MAERTAKDVLDNLFSYHPPTEEDVVKYNNLREAARVFADAIDANCPPSADRTAAMRQLQASVMTANRAIACKGESYR